MKKYVLIVKEMTGAQLESVVSTYSYEFTSDLDLNALDNLKAAFLNEPVAKDQNFATFILNKLNRGHYTLFTNS